MDTSEIVGGIEGMNIVTKKCSNKIFSKLIESGAKDYTKRYTDSLIKQLTKFNKVLTLTSNVTKIPPNEEPVI